MLKRDLTQVAVYSLTENVKEIPLECLKNLYLNQTSEIVYIVDGKKLWGIVCLGDVLYHKCDEKVKINQSYTFLTGFNLIKAHEIFQRRKNINKIPVVDEQGNLLGDYSRWDDLLFAQRVQEQFIQHEIIELFFKSYQKVYLIKPIQDKEQYFLQMIRYLDRNCIEYKILEKEQVGKKLYEESICIFLDEDEKRGIQCLLGIEPRRYDIYGNDILKYDILVNSYIKLRFASYKSILLELLEKQKHRKLNIQKPDNLFFDQINDKATILLKTLDSHGIKTFCLYKKERKEKFSEYYLRFQNEVNMREKAYPHNFRTPWPKKNENSEFYDDLYQNKDYENEIAQKEIFEASCNLKYKDSKGIYGKYFNAKDGRRITCYQPQDYIGTIYTLGACTIAGIYVEDQYTIASQLQRKLAEKGYPYRVENFAELTRFDGGIDSRLMEIESFCRNDIVIYQSGVEEAVDVEGISLEYIFEKNNMPSSWSTGQFGHCNHRANQKIAEEIIEMITPYLEAEKKYDYNIHINFLDAMKEYIKKIYLDCFFESFTAEKYNTIGSIVISSNPFSLGHRYLIKEARKTVDFLIVFVVQEDSLLFSFEERFYMTVEGTKDLDHVLVVPGGEYILSRKTFPQLFTRAESEAAKFNAEYDVQVFADYIAQPLHITHRFAGKGDQKRITKIYNDAMEKILSEKKIKYVEIPQKMNSEEVISTSCIRKNLRNREYEKAFALLPESTRQFLKTEI